MLILAKILLTIVTLGYSAIPAMFDSNNTHATNPSWTSHARFHVVWQVSSYVYVAILALYLTWTAGADVWPLWITAFLAAGVYAGFWTAVVSRPVYEGALVDAVNPVPPFRFNIAGKERLVDANIGLFTPAVVLLVITMGVLLAL